MKKRIYCLCHKDAFDTTHILECYFDEDKAKEVVRAHRENYESYDYYLERANLITKEERK